MTLTEGCRVVVRNYGEATFRGLNHKVPGDYWIEFDGGGGWWSFDPSDVTLAHEVDNAKECKGSSK